VDIGEALTFLEAIYGPFEAVHRIAPTALDAVEARIGASLPRALRTLYAKTGAARALHHAHNELVPPERIDFGGDHLVFYEENQAVVVWGIARSRLSEEDPPVEQGQVDRDTEAWSYFPEFESVSEFACAQGSWQAVQGGLPYVGVMEKFPGAHASGLRALNGAPVLGAVLGQPRLRTSGMWAWLVDGGVAIELPDAYVGLATRTAEQFSAACRTLDIALEQWDYATLRDD
jgi:hypothetical protein